MILTQTETPVPRTGQWIPVERAENEGMERGSTLPNTQLSCALVTMQATVSQSLGKAGKSKVNLTVQVLIGMSLGSSVLISAGWLRSSS